MALTNKIDFAIVFNVDRANPNGDPLNGNRPRVDYENYGEVSDVCLKRKIRNRLQDLGQKIYVQSDDRRDDGFRSLTDRANGLPAFSAALKKKDSEAAAQAACREWIDVRSFGQVFALGKSDDEEGGGVSIGVRGPVSIQCARSITPVEISSMQIVKSVNLKTNAKDPDKKTSDTMGQKHRVDFGVYVAYGSMSTQLAQKTGFTDEDAELVRQALTTLFENDESSARPDGSMEVLKVVWWRHNCPNGQYSAAKVHRCLKVTPKPGCDEAHGVEDCEINVEPLDGLEVSVYEGR